MEICGTRRPTSTRNFGQIFAAAPPNSFDSVAAPANVQKAFREHLGLEPGPSAKKEGEGGEARDDDGQRKPAEGDECPICADEMKVDGTGLNELVYDLGAGGCGQGGLSALERGMILLKLLVSSQRYTSSASRCGQLKRFVPGRAQLELRLIASGRLTENKTQATDMRLLPT